MSVITKKYNMITEVLNFTTSSKVEQIYLEKYNRVENLLINSFLGNQTCEERINALKDKFKDEPDDLILLVVKYVLPSEKPKDIDTEIWRIYSENNQNTWGFKILNPKLF